MLRALVYQLKEPFVIIVQIRRHIRIGAHKYETIIIQQQQQQQQQQL
jgi:hypothetical protein